ncbi:MAG: hypothetical protein HUJ27_16825 [Rhodobacteraceae bacterium]|nr:hypothetical protein [Paracoccaceae bacterium]
MKRLISKGLMFGNLVPVDSPALVERYNRALSTLIGRTTVLPDFHVDISGYSPEVGDELGDHLYLNPGGCNRQFILLTTAQKRAPLLNARFSTSRGILRRFIEDNEAELFALTARDAVAGELANSVFDLSDPARLLDIRRITVEADTTQSHVKNARKLAEKIHRFREEEDAWWDNALIAEMIDLARHTGDVTRHPVDLPVRQYEKGNFWTSHFGGLYIFRDLDKPAILSVGPPEALGKMPIPVIGLEDRNAVARFFERNDLVEPIVKARGMDAAAVLRQKMDFILIEAAAARGDLLEGVTRRDLRSLARQMGGDLPEAFHGLAALLRWAEGGGRWPKIRSDHPAYFYTLRSRSHGDRDLVNQLLAEIAPLDVRQLFICHKELFYRSYRGWSEAKKGYVAEFLSQEYMVDKAGARAALFGPEPGMAEPEDDSDDDDDDLIARVGPWGPVKRRRR